MTDSVDPERAIRDNVNAYRPSLLNSGYSNEEIDQAIQKLSAPYKKPSQN